MGTTSTEPPTTTISTTTEGPTTTEAPLTSTESQTTSTATGANSVPTTTTDEFSTTAEPVIITTDLSTTSVQQFSFQVTPGQNFYEMLTELLANILENYGITSITFSSTVRKRRSVQDVLNAVQNYGCWCSKPLTGQAYGGEALDEIDRICKLFSRCRKCEKWSNCAGS